MGISERGEREPRRVPVPLFESVDQLVDLAAASSAFSTASSTASVFSSIADWTESLAEVTACPMESAAL